MVFCILPYRKLAEEQMTNLDPSLWIYFTLGEEDLNHFTFPSPFFKLLILYQQNNTVLPSFWHLQGTEFHNANGELPRSQFAKVGNPTLAAALGSWSWYDATKEISGFNIFDLDDRLEKHIKMKNCYLYFSWMTVYIVYAELSSSAPNTE